jgi:chromosome segregation ATPase
MKRFKKLVSPRGSGCFQTPKSNNSKSSQINEPPTAIRVSTSPPEREAVEILKERVSILNERMADIDPECQWKGENFETEFKYISDQLQEIQSGISKVEEERQRQRASKVALEIEKRDIQEQLYVREREVQSLVKRCQAQDEKMRESAKLRVFNSDLSSQLDELKKALSMKEEEISRIDELQRDLQLCRESRDELRSRFEKLKKDHDDVVDTLNTCFLNMQKLQEKQSQHDEDCKRERKQTELTLEKQRLFYQEKINELKKEASNSKDRLDQMEDILKSSMATATSLRRERSELKDLLKEAVSARDNLAQRVCYLEQQQEQLFSEAEAKYIDELRDLQQSVQDKDLAIETLEVEVSTSLEKLMCFSDEIEKLKIENSQWELKCQQEIQKQRRDYQGAEDSLSKKENEFIILSSKLSIANKEKSEIIDEVHRLRDRVNELEEENAFIMHMEKELDEVNLSMCEVQQENHRLQETYQDMMDFRQQFDVQREMWSEMEKALTERLSSADTENKSLSLQLESEREISNDLRQKIELMEFQQRQCKPKTLDQHKDLLRVKEEEIMQLKTSIEKMSSKMVVEAKDFELKLNSLTQQLNTEQLKSEEKNDELQQVRIESTRYREESRTSNYNLKLQLEAQEATVSSLMEKLNLERRSKMESMKSLREENELARKVWRDEIDDLNKTLNEKRCQIESLQAELISVSCKGEEEQIVAEKNIKVQREQLESIQRDLDDCRRNFHRKSLEAERSKTELSKAQQQFHKDTLDLHESTAQCEKKIMALESELKRERNVSEEKDFTLTTLSKEIEICRQDLLKKNGIIISLESEVENFRTSRVNDQSKRDDFLSSQTKEIAYLSDELKSQKQILELITSERDDLFSKASELNSEVRSLQERLASQNCCVEELQSKLADEYKERDNSQRRNRELETGVERAKSEISRLHAENSSLKLQITSLQEEITSKKLIAQSQAEKITSLEADVAMISALSKEKGLALDEANEELLEFKNTFDAKHEQYRKRQAEQDQLISELQSNLHKTIGELGAKEALILSLSTEAECLRNKHAQEVKLWQQRQDEYDLMLTRKASEATSLTSLFEEKSKALQEELKSQVSVVFELKKSISDMESQMEKKDNAHRAIQIENDHRTGVLLNDIKMQKEKSQEKAQQHAISIQEKDARIVELNQRIHELQQHIESNSDKTNVELMAMKNKLQKTEIDLAIAQDELRDLKLFELKEAEETIESLESSLQTLRSKVRADETSSQAKFTEMQAYTLKLEATLADSEKGVADNKDSFERNMIKLQGELGSLKEENESLRVELKEKYSKLNDRHSTIASLTTQNAALELKEVKLLEQISNLESESQKAKEENFKLTMALEHEIEKQLCDRREDDIEFLQRQSHFEKKVQELEKTISRLKKEVIQLETTLESRTQILADMVAHNKETEEQKERALSELESSRQAADEYKESAEILQQEIVKMKAKFTKIEDELVFAIQTERELRETAEVDLENLHAKMRKKRDDKELTELEKENGALRDKVRRQEAFLLRKIQKDKVLRERNTRPTGITTPARTSQIIKPLSSTRKERHSPPSGLSESRYTDELDELLS